MSTQAKGFRVTRRKNLDALCNGWVREFHLSFSNSIGQSHTECTTQGSCLWSILHFGLWIKQLVLRVTRNLGSVCQRTYYVLTRTGVDFVSHASGICRMPLGFSDNAFLLNMHLAHRYRNCPLGHPITLTPRLEQVSSSVVPSTSSATVTFPLPGAFGTVGALDETRTHEGNHLLSVCHAGA